jgi:hypothetical protein
MMIITQLVLDDRAIWVLRIDDFRGNPPEFLEMEVRPFVISDLPHLIQ